MKVEELGEFGLIDKIRERFVPKDSRVMVGIGDDCCALEPGPGRVLIATTDSFVEGVHFDLSYFSYRQVGFRALSAALSDIAAVAGIPVCVLTSLFLPKGFETDAVDEMYAGMQEVAERYWATLAGGDTVKSPHLSLAVTVIGEVEKPNLTLRSGAKVGDSICVTGALGRSEAGLLALKKELVLDQKIARTHLTPFPRIEEARALVQSAKINAMIDISDGLAADLHHLAEESGVGAKIEKGRIPISEEARVVAGVLGMTPLDFIVRGGEDFELLFALPKEQVEGAINGLKGRIEVTEIGEMTETKDGVSIIENGKSRPLPRIGYDHFKTEGLSP